MKAGPHLVWEVLESREVFDGEPWLRVHRQAVRLPDGRVIDDYYQVEVPDCCIVYAETPAGEAILERQYKHGPRSVGLSLPAGTIEAGEPPLAAARRELLEETGYVADEWQALGSFTINGNNGGGQAHLFHARGARRVAEPDSGDLEQMEILLMPRAELVAAMLRGEVHMLGAVALISLAGITGAPAAAPGAR